MSALAPRAENENTRPTWKALRLAAEALALLDQVERLTRKCGAHHDDAMAARSAACRLKVGIGGAIAEDVLGRRARRAKKK